MFGGILLVVICFTLLELNHAAVGIQKEILPAIFKGLILGGSIITTMYWYTTSKDEYSGRWSDLKTFFLVFWLGFIVVLYLIKQYDPNIQDYQLLLPALIGFSSVALLNIILVIRKTSRGGFKLYFILGTFKRKLFEVEK
jgi:hypothetical protein